MRRAVMTGMGQVTGQISLHNAELGGTNLVEVTAHAGARDTGDGPANHKQWQGKVYSLVGSTPEYPNLAMVTGYGTVSGLKGANCRHDFFPFFEGLSQRAYSNADLQDIDPPPFIYEGKEYTAYEATQQQRKMETAIRATKRKTTAYEAAELKDDYTAQAVRLTRQRMAYEDFSRAAGLATQPQRTHAVGFGRRQAARATAANKSYIAKYTELRYNKNGTIVVTDDWTAKRHPRLPQKYRPNAVVDTVSHGDKQRDRTIYDADGQMMTQVHGGNHGNSKMHPYGARGEHVHAYTWTDGQGSKTTRSPQEDERLRYFDILGGDRNDS